MLNYIFKRLLFTIPMVVGITFITYLAIFLAPGGPAVGLMGDLNPRVSPEYREKLIKEYNFDKPFYVQYGLWVSKMARLDFGVSRKDNQPVTKKILERLPRTLLLTGSALILTFFLALPIGLLSALKQNTWIDRAMTVFVFMGFSIPMYWIALLSMILFGIYLGWLPITGFESILASDMPWPQLIWDRITHLILPVVIMALTGLAALSRYVRHEMLDVLRQDYIRAARAKGLSETRVIGVHALRNILIPLVTLVGLSLPDLISAGIIFETIFSYPGLGRLAYEAVMSRDIFLIMGTVTFAAFLTLIGNLIADVTYAYVDPRIRYH